MKSGSAWKAIACAFWSASPVMGADRCLEAFWSQELVAPPSIVAAIVAVESNGNPMALNVEGRTISARSWREAADVVEQAVAAGRCVDIGCMQVNTCYHSHRVQNPVDLLDPATNVRAGVAFLTELRSAKGNWVAAAGAYHSSTPSLNAIYRCRLATAIDPTYRNPGCIELLARNGGPWHAPS
ncbi:transglycosylase SLT domain-containing protein [Asticcacaulis sp.]|uniref:transglycosylase SLT domain-containing protein n=1 Tax=Asticcacaulis sp. TaxID=1872648 RepID=UPI00262CAA06|nr:transglycosylase SLT domain-containing protein [Asticcacaulis sp.]